MNLLEHYVTNITREEAIEKNGMLFSRLYVMSIVMATKRFRKKFCLQKMIMQRQRAKVII